MIPQDFIAEWKKAAPWPQNDHVEQDLIMARHGVGTRGGIYVADSALATEENLSLMGDDILFITRLPENFGVCGKLIGSSVMLS